MKKQIISIITGLSITGLAITGCANNANQLTSQAAASTAENAVTDHTGNADAESSDDANESSSSESTLSASDLFTDRDLSSDYEEEDSVHITLNADTAESDSDAAVVSGGVITIREEGTYIFSGSISDGMIVVDVEDTDKVQIVLNGAEITSSTSAAIYVKNADKVFITTVEGTENTLANGGEYIAVDENNIDAVIYAKDDITINGKGTLVIEAPVGHGIVSKDDLKITGGTIQITAAEHGLSANDSIRIADGTIVIDAGEDGIHSDNDEDTELGYVYIADGLLTISAGDDGIHGSSNVTIENGVIHVTDSYEGIEGLTIDINGGEITVLASDDGLNAAGGTDSSGFGGPGGGDMFGSTEGAYISITGGTIYVNSQGDGIDSNGELIVSGGVTYVYGPTDGANGALDYDSQATITGGTFVAMGSMQMAQNFSDGTQGSMLLTVSGGSEGDVLALTDENGEVLLTWTAEKAYNCVVVSTPDLAEGETYTLTAGDTSQEITLDTLMYGSAGMGGMMGGQGKGMGGQGRGMGGRRSNSDAENGEKPEGMTEGGRPEMPEGMSEGEMPEMPENMPEGEMPQGPDSERP